jgi:uncharacterized protein YyaL (SSP411 family)
MAHESAGAGNRLALETSPYLRQHAGNPVDWQPWDAAALEQARREQKPILLSIGYAACHWCHVMAHESFEDAATAELMNRHFVNIKVDREERPDLDRIYQLAHRLLSERGGGWPLTVFLTHDGQQPFFAGTYFPREPRYGLPGFADLLGRVAAHYAEHGPQLHEHASAVVQALAELDPPATPGDFALQRGPIAACRAQLERSFDGRWGGFGPAPKFPHAPLVQRLLRDWHASAGEAVPDLQALYMASLTLTRMAEGGLFDQLAGGFCRYSVDERWAIPHFEKMLYDNAQLLGAYADAACATGEALFATVAARTADWLLAAMRAPGGAFYSSLDADAAGVEGSSYVWRREQLAVLTPQENALFAQRFGLHTAPNFEGESWHLVVSASLEQLALEHGLEPDAVNALLASASARLLAIRGARVQPGLDDKILTSWNALAIKGLATAARTLARSDLADAAAGALGFLRAHHWRDGHLLATSAGGAARLEAYLDDHVFLADAILELATVRFDASELGFAVQLLEAVLARFVDPKGGGCWFTPRDGEALIARPKSYGDEALPAGNGVAAVVLQRYGYLLGEPRYLAAAERILRAAWAAIERYPPGHATLLQALDEALEPPEFVILRGDAGVLGPWQQQLAMVYAPRRVVLAIPGNATGLPPALASKAAPAEGGVAYVCSGSVCSAPLTSLAQIAAALGPSP